MEPTLEGLAEVNSQRRLAGVPHGVPMGVPSWECRARDFEAKARELDEMAGGGCLSESVWCTRCVAHSVGTL